MKPEVIARLKQDIKIIPDDSLAQFFAIVIEEANRRGEELKHPKRIAVVVLGEDCEPIRGY